jgi:hypothetical protein
LGQLIVPLAVGVPHREQPWTDPKGKPIIARERCSKGCKDRALEAERQRDINGVCLECLTWTWDRPDYRIPGPHSWTAEEADRRWLRKQDFATEEQQAKAREVDAKAKVEQKAKEFRVHARKVAKEQRAEKKRIRLEKKCAKTGIPFDVASELLARDRQRKANRKRIIEQISPTA